MPNYQCSECGSKNTDEFTETQIHCRDCGAITDKNAEYIPPEPEENPNFDKPSTSWSKTVKIHDSTEKNIARTLSTIITIIDQLELPPNIAEQAAENYRKIFIKTNFKGRRLASIAAACTYLASKQENYPVSLTLIAETANVERKHVGRDYKFILSKTRKKKPRTRVRDYQNCLEKIIETPKHRNIAEKVIEGARTAGLTQGVNPLGVLAASAYYSAKILGIKTTYRQMAESSRITQRTIKRRKKELTEALLVEVFL